MDPGLELLLERALRVARDTAALQIAPGAVRKAADVFRSQFDQRPAMIIADPRTFAVAGKAVLDRLRESFVDCTEPFIFPGEELHAEFDHVSTLEAVLAKTDAVPVAVGSGTINDLTKLAAFRAGRAYMVVGTAASMDGYSSFGASITYKGSKQTFDCPAPRAVLVDLEIVAAAPQGMNAWGFADLLAKLTCGADWIIADALGVELIDPVAWDLVQGNLHELLHEAAGVRTGAAKSLECLLAGLMISGFAMQRTRTSRPASGAEHQFSHLWDMQGHTHRGVAPSHGFKVGIATVAVTRLYEQLLATPLADLDVQRVAREWPEWSAQEAEIRRLYDRPAITDKALEQGRAKYVDRARMLDHLERIRTSWPEMRNRLQRQLLPSAELRRMLAGAGAPADPEQIGITPQRLRDSFRQAAYIRSRYTALDLAMRTGAMQSCLDRIFGPAMA